MAALTGITAVRLTSNTIINRQPLEYGATITLGQTVYRISASGKYGLCDTDLSLEAATAAGIAVISGVDTSYGVIATGGSIILVGTTMVVGTTYYAGPNAGEIIPEGDLASADYVTRLGIAATATQLDLLVQPTGILRA